MLRRLLVAALLAAFSSHAFAQGADKTKSALTGEVPQLFPDNITGAITPSNARQIANDLIISTQQTPTVNAQTGTSYTFAQTDYGLLVTFNNANAVAATLPEATASNSFYPWNVYVTNLGTGTVTITPTGSTINGAASLAVTTGGSVQIVSDGINYQLGAGISGSSGFPQMPAHTVLGNNTASTAAPVNETMTNLLAQFGVTPSAPLYGAQGSFWANINDADGNENARQHYFRDRIFVDDGALATGNESSTLGAGNIIAESRSGTAINGISWDWAANGSSLLSISSWGAQAITGYSVLSSQARTGNPLGGASTIGVSGFGLNNLTTTPGPTDAWGGYFEVIRTLSGAGSVTAVETDTGTVSTVDVDPYTGGSPSTGVSGGLNPQCGGSAQGVSYTNCSYGITLSNNGAKWRRGIVFNNTGLDTSLGTGGGGEALVFASGQELIWYSAASTPFAELYAHSGTPGFLTSTVNLQVPIYQGTNGSGHHVAIGSTSTPSANTCAGFSAATGSSDTAGHATITNTDTSCSITFGQAFTNAPTCVASATGSLTEAVTAVTSSTTGLSVTFAAAGPTGISWICVGS